MQLVPILSLCLLLLKGPQYWFALLRIPCHVFIFVQGLKLTNLMRLIYLINQSEGHHLPILSGLVVG
jgi:hypothetical protein